MSTFVTDEEAELMKQQKKFRDNDIRVGKREAERLNVSYSEYLLHEILLELKHISTEINFMENVLC